jgi:mono/diheme cytochrome c family protein
MMKFFLGFIVGVCLLLAAEYLFIAGGGVKMGTDATTLPLEDFLAHQAIAASMGKAAKEESTVPADETNLLAGAQIYQTKGCSGCHGRIDDPNSGAGTNFYPLAPHLLSPSKGVTDDEVGETHRVVKNGIRFSGMPTYGARLSDTEIWQVSQLLHNADKLPASVQEALRHPAERRANAAASPTPTATTVATPSPEPSASPIPSATP